MMAGKGKESYYDTCLSNIYNLISYMLHRLDKSNIDSTIIVQNESFIARRMECIKANEELLSLLQKGDTEPGILEKAFDKCALHCDKTLELVNQMCDRLSECYSRS